MALNPGSTEEFDVCRYIEDSESWEGRCPGCGAPYWKTVPTSFIREEIAELRATWVKWQEKWGRQDNGPMEDIFGSWSADEADKCLACGWDSGNPEGLRPAPECYCHERRDYPERVAA